MATSRVIRYVAGGKNRLPAVHLHCRVRPNASKAREGVTSVTDDAVEVCVAAVPRDGESNKAVLSVLSEVLGVPRSDLQIARGTRSREKLISVGGKGVQGGEECVERLLERLGEAARGGRMSSFGHQGRRGV